MPARSPLFAALRHALRLARHAQQPGAVPLDELLGQAEAHRLNRRAFLRGSAGLSAGLLLAGCAAPGPAAPTVPAGGANGASGPRVAIVGAGLAGLVAARTLARQGVRATLYEAASRTGGRIFSARDVMGQGLVTELGAEFIDTGHPVTLGLARELGLTLLDAREGVDPKLQREAYRFGGRTYGDAELVAALAEVLPRLAADQGGLPEAYGHAVEGDWRKLDALSLDAYLDQVGASGWLRRFLEVAYTTEYGLEPGEQSALNLVALVGAELVDGRFEVFGESDERYKVVGGNQRIPEALAAELQDRIVLEHRLEAIDPAGTGYRLTFAQSGGRRVEVEADLVVLTLPFTMLRQVAIRVELPAVKRQAIRELGYGTNAKLMLAMRGRPWAQTGYLGNFFTDDALQSGWDNALLQPGDAAGLTVYTGGRNGEALGQGTALAQAEGRIEALEALFPGARGAFAGRAERFHWPTHPLSLGSYACYKPGQIAAFGGAEGEAVGRLFFAGEHCSTDFQGYMEGAAETGKQAAEAALAALGKVLVAAG
jgi:monoamine oxidase